MTTAEIRRAEWNGGVKAIHDVIWPAQNALGLQRHGHVVIDHRPEVVTPYYILDRAFRHIWETRRF